MMTNATLAGGRTLGLSFSRSATILVCPSRFPILVPQSYICVANSATSPQKRANNMNTQQEALFRCIAIIGAIQRNDRGTIIIHQMFIFQLRFLHAEQPTSLKPMERRRAEPVEVSVMAVR